MKDRNFTKVFPILSKNTILKRVKTPKRNEKFLYLMKEDLRIDINDSTERIVELCNGTNTFEMIINKIKENFIFETEKDLYKKCERVIQWLVSISCIELNNSSIVKKRNIYKEVKLNSVLTNVYFLLTNKCNLKCRHCSFDSGNSLPDELTTSEIFNVLDQIGEVMANRITFSGGEIFTKEDILSIIQYAKNIPLQVVLNTNGYFIDEEMAKQLSDLEIDGVQISLDGASPETCSFLRNDKEAFSRAVNAIRFMKEMGILTSTMTMVHKKNMLEMRSIFKLLTELRVENSEFMPIVPLKRGKTFRYLSTLEDYKSVRRELNEYKNKIGEDINLPTQIQNNQSRCGACQMQIAIKSNGNILPCSNFNDFIFGNVKDSHIKDILNSNELIDSFLSMIAIENSECKNCELLKYCGGGCPAISSVYSGSPHNCDILKKIAVSVDLEFVG